MTLFNRIIAVLEASEHPLSTAQLVEIIYSDDPDGGPDHAVKAIGVTICNQRKRGDTRIVTLKNGYGIAGREYATTSLPKDGRADVIRKLRDEGLSYGAIGERFGISANYSCMLYRRAAGRAA